MRRPTALAAATVALTSLALPASATPDPAATCASMSSPFTVADNSASTLTSLAATVPDGYTPAGAFAASDAPAPGLTAVHKLTRAASGDTVWMPEGPEMTAAVSRWGYVDTGTAFHASATALPCATPVYRTLTGGTHQFTASASVRAARLAAGASEGHAAFWVARPRPLDPRDTDGTFSIAVYPDTQGEARVGDGRFAARSRAVASAKDARDYRFVAHSGDVVDWGWLAPEQYRVASDAMKPIEEAGIPYSLAVGNHDTRAVGWNGVPGSTGYGGSAFAQSPLCAPKLGTAECSTPKLVRHTEEFNATFTAARFGAVKGAFEPGKVDNIYSTFTAGGREWMVLNLELWPRPEVIAWANQVAAANPKANILVVTHAYLEPDGSISTSNGGYGASSPRQLYDGFVTKNSNVVGVFSGHTGSFASRTDTRTDGTKVASFLETMHAPAPSAPYRTVEFDVTKGTITSSMLDATTGTTLPGSEVTVTGLTFR